MVAVNRGIVDEHTELAALISSVRRSHAAGASWEDLARMLDELVATVRAHFTSEEQQMERAAYPMLVEHRKNHETFLRRLLILREECDRQQTELMAVFMDLLDNWFKNHERTADGLLLEYLSKQR
jgi:hemerythrin-like metal-binding protein